MCRELTPSPRVTVTAFEQDLPSAYTAATLAHLKLRHPGVRFVWLMGADNLASFHHWQDWRAIARDMPIAVVDRPGWRLRSLAGKAALFLRKSYVPEQYAAILATMSPPAWTFLTGPLSPLSSTEIREKSIK